MQEARTTTSFSLVLIAHQNPSFRPKLLAPLRVAQRRNPLLYLNSIPATAPLLIAVFDPRAHRDKTRRHQQYNKTNTHHPVVHGSILSSAVKSASTIASASQQTGPRTSQQTGPRNRGRPVLQCAIPKATRSCAFFHNRPENKSQNSGTFLSATQHGVFCPRQPRISPQIHQQKTTPKT
jgi:hypothetical protein